MRDGRSLADGVRGDHLAFFFTRVPQLPGRIGASWSRHMIGIDA
jgi:hypothetical protein